MPHRVVAPANLGYTYQTLKGYLFNIDMHIRCHITMIAIGYVYPCK